MFLCAALLLAAAVPCATEILIEAEDMTVKRGWKVEAGAQFNGQPNLWSAARLTADETDAPAEAFTDIAVPRPGMYRLWVHYESCYGFGSVFSVEVEQRGRRQRAVFGRKTAEKYFPFGRGWAVQGPWDWHNTDYVYEYADFDLQRGPARVWLTKGENEQPPALRVVDFLLLTTDLSGEPGDDWQWQSLLTHFTIPLRLRVECVASDKRVLPVVRPRLWLIGYYKGPMVDYYIARKRLVAVKDGPPPEEEWLGSGQRTEWLTINVHKAMPAWITFAGNSGAHLRVSLDYLVSGRRVSRTVDWRGPSLELICPVGNERYEADLTGRARIITMDELVEDRRRQAESYSPPGRRPRRIFVRTGLVDQPDFIRLGAAMGINAQAYGISAKIYAKEAPDLGFIKSRAFTSVQNWFITKQCLEGDFSALEDALRKL
ncbi:MAG: hypothetical protein H5T86_11945, partial [Armatimonadetes bacterium]|nr:hypothetical protein [Armatimonadota bacterium]